LSSVYAEDFNRQMSALGHKRTLRRSFDYLVGKREQLVLNFQVEHFGSLAIDDKIKFCRL